MMIKLILAFLTLIFSQIILNVMYDLSSLYNFFLVTSVALTVWNAIMKKKKETKKECCFLLLILTSYWVWLSLSLSPMNTSYFTSATLINALHRGGIDVPYRIYDLLRRRIKRVFKHALSYAFLALFNIMISHFC